MDDVDRLARAHEAARAVLQDQAVAVDGGDAHASRPSEKKASTGVGDADAVAEPDLGVGWDRRADDAQLASLEVDPERLAEAPKAPRAPRRRASP